MVTKSLNVLLGENMCFINIITKHFAGTFLIDEKFPVAFSWVQWDH